MTKSKDQDFQSFVTNKDLDPPQSLDESILKRVKGDLNPSHQKVFAKLTIIQSFVGFLTLIFCPQFNFSLTNNYDLFHYFHRAYGEEVCMIICGSIFIGSGAIFASYILKTSEIKKIQNSRFLYYFSLISVFLTTFLILGAEIYVTLTIYWCIGAFISGMVMIELNQIIRKQILR